MFLWYPVLDLARAPRRTARKKGSGYENVYCRDLDLCLFNLGTRLVSVKNLRCRKSGGERRGGECEKNIKLRVHIFIWLYANLFWI